MKNVIDFISYVSTISEATGYRRRSEFAKYGIIGAKFLLSVFQDRSEENLMKEVGQATVSALCDCGGRVTGDSQAAAQIELIGNVAIDSVMVASDSMRRLK